MKPITKQDVDERINRAGVFLRNRVTNLPVTPDDLIAAADKANLPIGLDYDNDPVARAIFVAAFVGEAKQALQSARDAVWRLLNNYTQAMA